MTIPGVGHKLLDVGHVNGAVAMPIKTAKATLDGIGYPGWEVTFRTNPPSWAYDKFLSSDTDEAWEGFKAIIVEWNFGDEAGVALPLPKDGLKREQLPFDVIIFLVRQYLEEFNTANKLPKDLDNSSEGTSQT
jgi:hypothetical protein